jgi:hypothetical protein
LLQAGGLASAIQFLVPSDAIADAVACAAPSSEGGLGRVVCYMFDRAIGPNVLSDWDVRDEVFFVVCLFLSFLCLSLPPPPLSGPAPTFIANAY